MTPTEATFELGDFALSSGTVLPDARLAYAIHGELNAAKDNVIVYPTWYAGTHHDNAGMIAPGRAIDPDRYFIVVPDQFSNGLSSSPSNAPPPYDRARFPLVTPYDNVTAQRRMLAEVFGVDSVALVVGFSMSGQQAYHWAAAYPDVVRRIAVICGSAKTSPHNWLFLEGVKLALRADAARNAGDYESQPEVGLRAFGTVYAGWAASQAFFREGLHLAAGARSVWMASRFIGRIPLVIRCNRDRGRRQIQKAHRMTQSPLASDPFSLFRMPRYWMGQFLTMC